MKRCKGGNQSERLNVQKVKTSTFVELVDHC